MTIVYVVAYIICFILSYWLMQHTWRYDYDLHTSDAIFLMTLSLVGPISLASAVFIWFIERPKKSKCKDPVIKYKHTRY